MEIAAAVARRVESFVRSSLPREAPYIHVRSNRICSARATHHAHRARTIPDGNDLYVAIHGPRWHSHGPSKSRAPGRLLTPVCAIHGQRYAAGKPQGSGAAEGAS